METTSESTRARLTRMLLHSGGSTASALAAELGLTGPAVRRHLDAMLADGALTSILPASRGPRGRGRPARIYRLTEAGRSSAPQAYDDLAASALRYLAAAAGDTALTAFAAARVADLEGRYAEQLAGAGDASGRARALADALTAEGYAAAATEVHGADGHLAGVQLCQHHCPVQHVATEFPQLCEAETEVFSRLLGRSVQRLATLAHGDPVCTTFLPVAAAPSGARQASAFPAPPLTHPAPPLAQPDRKKALR